MFKWKSETSTPNAADYDEVTDVSNSLSDSSISGKKEESLRQSQENVSHQSKKDDRKTLPQKIPKEGGVIEEEEEEGEEEEVEEEEEGKEEDAFGVGEEQIETNNHSAQLPKMINSSEISDETDQEVRVELDDMQPTSMKGELPQAAAGDHGGESDNLDDDETPVGGEGMFHQGLRSNTKEGPQPLQLPQMDSPVGDEDDEDEEDDGQIAQLEGSYDPADYEHLAVSPEMKELFTFISKYTPQNIELEHQLRPYIPDYIPAVGDIDAFIKIPRPDTEPSTVGLTVLDEPSAKQSDATVLDLQLRAVAKHTTARSVVVKTVENAENNSKIIDKWMKDISDLHRAKPPPTVHYAKRMPDIDSLMQEWPGEVEEILKEVNLPSAALQVELPHYVDIICSIFDIPVYKSRIQSLHVLFTLFSVFKNSANFRHLAEENAMDNEDSSGEPDRLVLESNE